MTQFEDVLETILEEYARRDSEGEFDTWEETDAFVKEKAEVLLAYVKEEPVSNIWHNFSEELPPIGVSVIAYHHLWVDEDFNPQGTRIGFLQDNLASDNCKYDFVSAHWWNYQDTYMTISKIDIEGREDEFSDEIKSCIMPEYWIEIPSINAKIKSEEPVSEDLKKASIIHSEIVRNTSVIDEDFIDGVQWQKEHLWKSADGEDLPEYDRDVIVLTQTYPLEGNEYAVSFAHRPAPKEWDGKNISTGEVEHYTPKTYDKGGWNIPNVKYWLDCNMDSIFKRNNENSKINKR